MQEYRYDTQLLIEGNGLDEDAINDYFTESFKGDSLLLVGDDEVIKIHYHTNEPWKVLEYCASLGEIFDVVIEDMDRQASKGSQGLERAWLVRIVERWCYRFEPRGYDPAYLYQRNSQER